LTLLAELIEARDAPKMIVSDTDPPRIDPGDQSEGRDRTDMERGARVVGR
jgi:hypothetical protein